MKRFSLFLCLLAIFISDVRADLSRRLEGEGIIGGDKAKEGQFPYQVSVEIIRTSICGGSILDERYIITAAHCVMSREGRFNNLPLRVVGGVNDLQSKSEKNRVAVDVIEVYVPKEYDPSNIRSRTTGDIAILKLNKNLNITTNKNLGKVELPRKGQTFDGKTAIVSGFGWVKVDVEVDPIINITRETDGESDEKLHYAKAVVLSNDECLQHYLRPIKEKHICAAVVQRDTKKPEGVCSGDSGGPLVFEGIQIGVVSTSPAGCREDSKPAVYTRVSEYVNFIRKVMNGQIDEDIRTHTLKPFPIKSF